MGKDVEVYASPNCVDTYDLLGFLGKILRNFGKIALLLKENNFHQSETNKCFEATVASKQPRR